MITAYATEKPIDYLTLYRTFIEQDGDRSGTVVIHHGMVKRPGKQIANFTAVELKALKADVDRHLGELANGIAEQYALNQLLLVHRIGYIGPRDSVLLVIVSGTTRDRCFAACSSLVDMIKQEEIIQLIEHQ
jgi:molybdopterin synthase catalytic subunit